MKPTFETTQCTFESENWKGLKTYLIATHEEYQDRNGLPYCKNCGVDHKELVNKIEEILDQQKKEILSQTEQECDKKWEEKALGNEKLLKDIHRLELDAISCMSLEKFMKWSDDRKEKSKTEALQDLLNNK